MRSLSAADKGRVIPKKFYVVMPFGSRSRIGEIAIKDLSTGVLHGVKGISDKAVIIMQWYGIARDAILAMDGQELVRLNKLSRVQYDNPEYLVSNGMSAMYRIFDKKPEDKYGPAGLAGNLSDYVGYGLKAAGRGSELAADANKVSELLMEASIALNNAMDSLPEDKDDRKYLLRHAELDEHDLKFIDQRLRKAGEYVESFMEVVKQRLSKRDVEVYLDPDNYTIGAISKFKENKDQFAQDARDWGHDEAQIAAFGSVSDAVTLAIDAFAALGDLAVKATKQAEAMGRYQNVIWAAQRGDLRHVLEDTFKGGTSHIKTVKGLARAAFAVAKGNHQLRDMTLEDWEDVLTKGLKHVGTVYGDEGEWLVKDQKLKIPPKSVLWLSRYPLPEDVEARRKAGETTDLDKFVHRWAIEANNEMDRLIKENSLEEKYVVRRIDQARFEEARKKWHLKPKAVAASGQELFHTTSTRGLESILESGELRGHPFVSFSERPYTGDISFNDVTLVFAADAFGDRVEKVQYTRKWFDTHGEQASYIAGDGWAEQYEVPEDCFDEEGFEDPDCSSEAYREAELQSFLDKSRENEWISKARGSLPFKKEDLLRVIVHKGDNKSVQDTVVSLGYSSFVTSKDWLVEAGTASASLEGDKLAAWCASAEGHDVLDSTSLTGSSWQAGGCVLLARAIQKNHPAAELVGIELDGRTEHVGAQLGNTVYDANGAHPRNNWVSNWLSYERITNDGEATIISYARGDIPDAEPTEEDVSLVAAALRDLMPEAGVLEAGTSLSAAEWYWRELKPEFAKFGWVPSEDVSSRTGGKHQLLINPNIPEAPPLTISRGHLKGPINPWTVHKYASDIGLRAPPSRKEITAEPRHPYAAVYRKMGLLPPEEGAVEQVSWGPPDAKRVPMDKVDFSEVSTEHEWKEAKWLAAFRKDSSKVPVIKVLDLGDGSYLAEDETLASAAKKFGMTHAPIETV